MTLIKPHVYKKQNENEYFALHIPVEFLKDFSGALLEVEKSGNALIYAKVGK